VVFVGVEADDGVVTVAPESSQHAAPACWCCGGGFDEQHLVRLGSHPEVGVCFGCVRFLQRRVAERQDELRPSAATRLRSGVRAVREWVISRGWHDRPVLGRLLRWIDRFLP
jgi:hypothetical protein